MSGSATPLRWGVLSTARILEELLPGFEASPTAELVAIASRDGERAARFADVNGIATSYGSYEELLADETLECVYIPLPNSLHSEWVRAALQAGKHVLCEKPMTPNSAEAQELFDLAAAHDLRLMEAFMYRHHSKTKKLRELIEQGAIGDPRVVRMRFHFRVEDPASDIRYMPDMAGGALRDVGCYCVSLANYLADAAPREVVARMSAAPSGVDETFAATMEFGSGMVAVFDCGMASPLDVGVEVLGSEGRAIVEMPWYAHLEPLAIFLETPAGSTRLETPGANAYQLELENFCAAVRGEAEPEISATETVRNLQTIERLIQAATTDPPVPA
jgi:predicted dehydrogenase